MFKLSVQNGCILTAFYFANIVLHTFLTPRKPGSTRGAGRDVDTSEKKKKIDINREVGVQLLSANFGEGLSFETLGPRAEYSDKQQ